MNLTDEQIEVMEIVALTGMVTRLAMRSLEDYFNANNIQLSQLQYGIMRTLSHAQLTQSELSRRFSLDPSTLVATLSSLVRKGYVQRERDPKDRRRTPLSLTHEGKALLESIHMPNDTPLHSSLTALGEEKARQLRDLLREIIRNMPNGDDMLRDMQARIQAHRTGKHSDSC